MPIQIQVFEEGQLAFSEEFDGPVEVGRQSDANEDAFTRRLDEQGTWRLVIAKKREQTVSRKHARIDPVSGGRVRLTNISSLIPLTLTDGSELPPQGVMEVSMPASLTIGRKSIHITEGSPEQTLLKGLTSSVAPPPTVAATPERLPALELPRDGGIDVESLMNWLRTIMGVLQTAASTSDFFDRAARGVVDIVGLDAGRVLLFDGDGWRIEASARPGVGPGAFETMTGTMEMDNWRPSRRVLNRLRAEKRTFWEEPDPSAAADTMSLAGVAAVVAAPIIDRRGEVIGCLYGERRQGGRADRARAMMLTPQISRVDAMMVELLASGVAAGLARIEQEKAALAARVQFEQFFTPELARELAVRPDLLKGQDREVSLIFADIRGFSGISELIGPAKTMAWIYDVMGVFSDCVLAHSGVLVDYIGDEIIAMWGAPKTEPAHARLACRAALDMLAKLPEINEKWRPILGKEVDLGIGVNTGTAQVGNTGTVHKFKYGALGPTVNLASRVQGASKYLKTNLVITQATRDRLDSNFAVRQICDVRVVNIKEPVRLYELVPAGLPGWESLRKGYEEALTMFYQKEFRQAARMLGILASDFPEDGPTLNLMARAVEWMVKDNHDDFDHVVRLPGK
ncbi:MAG: adenylate/guanylate cyclase domain-containing protein [Isosphaeraceae bacterium]